MAVTRLSIGGSSAANGRSISRFGSENLDLVRCCPLPASPPPVTRGRHRWRRGCGVCPAPWSNSSSMVARQSPPTSTKTACDCVIRVASDKKISAVRADACSQSRPKGGSGHARLESGPGSSRRAERSPRSRRGVAPHDCRRGDTTSKTRAFDLSFPGVPGSGGLRSRGFGRQADDLYRQVPCAVVASAVPSRP
jgi:hypothetical protein